MSNKAKKQSEKTVKPASDCKSSIVNKATMNTTNTASPKNKESTSNCSHNSHDNSGMNDCR